MNKNKEIIIDHIKNLSSEIKELRNFHFLCTIKNFNFSLEINFFEEEIFFELILIREKILKENEVVLIQKKVPNKEKFIKQIFIEIEEKTNFEKNVPIFEGKTIKEVKEILENLEKFTREELVLIIAKNKYLFFLYEDKENEKKVINSLKIDEKSNIIHFMTFHNKIYNSEMWNFILETKKFFD